jgi:two-component system chemotaxis sensor kinase CheA
MSDIDPETLQIFRDETRERLERVVDLVLAHEAGTAPADAVDALFRDAHSIKGNCGMVGFHDAASIAGAMEEILSAARRSGVFPDGAAGPMLNATDAIQAAIEDVDGAGAIAALAIEQLDAVRGLGSPVGSRGSGGGDADPGTEPSPDAGPDVDSPSPPVPVRSSSVRVGTEKIDRLLDVVGETVLHQRRLEHLLSIDGRDDESVSEELGGGSTLLEDLQDSVIQMRTIPLRSIVGPLPRAVRDLAAELGKEVTLTLSGTDTQLDRVILDGISETIVHILRNAVSHGIERPSERVAAGKPRGGTVALLAEQRGGLVAVTITDDGRGVGSEVIRRAAEVGSLTDVLTEPGFSTAGEVTEVAGRGVGLDAVREHVKSVGGDLDIQSEPRVGTSVTMLLPLTLALLEILLVERGDGAFGIPLASVAEALSVDSITSLGGRPAIDLRGETVSLTDLAAALDAQAPPLPDRPPAVVITAGGHRAAVMCDRLLGDQEAVVKSLGSILAPVAGYLGATILPDGRIALILDPSFLIRRQVAAQRVASAPSDRAPEPVRSRKVLVVDDQFTVRELQRRILEGADYQAVTAPDGRRALEALNREPDIELVITDIEMPELDGLELLRAIRADPARAALPVVIVSSRGSTEDRTRGADAGADAYVVKAEFDQRALLDTVARLMGRG